MSDIFVEIGGYALAVTLVAVVHWLWPAVPPLAEKNERDPELQARYRKRILGFFGTMLVACLVMGAVMVGVVEGLFRLRILLLPEMEIFFGPDQAALTGAGILLGVSLGMSLGLRWSMKWQADHWEEMVIALNQAYQLNYLKVLKFLCYLIVAGGGFLMISAMNHYTYFTQDKIVQSGFWELRASHHPMEEVKRIKYVKKWKAPNGKYVSRPYYQVDFADGSEWSSKYTGKSKDGDVQDAIRLVSENSLKGIDTIPVVR